MSESIVLSVIAAVIVLVEFKRLVCNQIPHETFHECKVTQARRSAVWFYENVNDFSQNGVD